MFCTKGIFGHFFRARSVSNVIGEIKEVVSKYHVEEIDILDDTFTLDLERAEKICDEIIKEGITIKLRLSNGIRVDCITPSLLEKLKKAGCYQISYGVESGDDEVLQSIGKEITTDVARKAFQMTKKAGISTIAFFMLGLPFDTPETMQRTIEFAKELDPDYAQFTVTTPLPGTRLWRWVQTHGRLLMVQDWARFDLLSGKICFETDNFSQKDVEKICEKAYRSFYLRPAYFFKTLFRIRSWEDVKITIQRVKFFLSLALGTRNK